MHPIKHILLDTGVRIYLAVLFVFVILGIVIAAAVDPVWIILLMVGEIVARLCEGHYRMIMKRRSGSDRSQSSNEWEYIRNAKDNKGLDVASIHLKEVSTIDKVDYYTSITMKVVACTGWPGILKKTISDFETRLRHVIATEGKHFENLVH